MGLFSKHRKTQTFKVGECVCFLLQTGKEVLETAWCMGEIVKFIPVKGSDEMLAEISRYDFSSELKDEVQKEWSSLDPLPFEMPSEVIIMGIVSSHTKLSFQRFSKNTLVPMKDLCKATGYEFTLALQSVHIRTLCDGRQIYYK